MNGYEEYTQKEVADALGISQSYISRLEKKIIKKLKIQIEKVTWLWYNSLVFQDCKDVLIVYFTIFIIYMAVINISSAIMCCYDKTQARVFGKRVSESNLLTLCILGGSPAMYFTMKFIRHKTRKKKFMIGIPVIMAIQLILFVLFLLYF